MVIATEVLRSMLLREPSELAGRGVSSSMNTLPGRSRAGHHLGRRSSSCAPNFIQLVCLSATVSNAPEVADVDRQGPTKPIHLVTHLKRAVPLSLYYFPGRAIEPIVINSKGSK